MDNEPAKSPASASYAFLNHSTTTVPNNLPPSVDDKPLARQKRRRTSPEDQAILEAAYKRDPKPDKTARQELVKHVALGEKEVQIWFQNRRQSSRRKSRPLLPHEFAQYQLSRATNQGDSPPPSCLDSSSPPDSGQDLDTVSRESTPAAPEHNEQTSTISDRASQRDPASSVVPASTSVVTQPLGYLANRRSAASFYQASMEQMKPTVVAKPDLDRRLKKSASLVRLSLNAEGKAEVVTKDAASPSPPRPPQTLLPDVTSSAESANRLQRSYSGRSRDSRAWEFWCDKESRSEFEHTAEKDASGSAAGAIGLLRTTSGRNILGSLSSKRNAPFSGHHPSKRSKLDHKRPPLQRSNTSLGRLQGETPTGSIRPAPKLKHSESAKPRPAKESGDSDKENVSPRSDAEPHERIRLSHIRQDRSSAGVVTDPEKDEELSAFMRGGQKKSSASGDDDLDCVQGLLSLSQGNWR